jgi:hypothetical protein
MSLRTTRHTATFNEPFSLRNVEGVQPAGEYNVFNEDELITGLSRTVWRRVLTLIQTPSISSIQEDPRLVVISQVELDAALMRDQHLTVSPGNVEKR